MSVMLVTSAGLLVHSFWSVLRVDPGFRAEGVMKAEYQLPASRYPARDYRIWPNWVARLERTAVSEVCCACETSAWADCTSLVIEVMPLLAA